MPYRWKVVSVTSVKKMLTLNVSTVPWNFFVAPVTNFITITHFERNTSELHLKCCQVKLYVHNNEWKYIAVIKNTAPRKAICVVDDEIDLSDSTINKVLMTIFLLLLHPSTG